MLKLTESAIQRLESLLLEHPEDPIVRVSVRDLDEAKLVFSITLEDSIQPGDAVQRCGGLTVALCSESAPRMKGVTLDYQESRGFLFHHGSDEQSDLMGTLNLN